jgi:FkbM family methyltransferase
MKKLIQNILASLDITVHRKSALLRYFDDRILRSDYKNDIDFVLEFGSLMQKDQLVDLISKSKAQLRQDIFALYSLDFHENGYFVEFGATDGVTLSNTWLLEKEFGYTGVLAEPSHNQRKFIRRSRNANIEEKCVWSVSGDILQFQECGDLSTISEFSNKDLHANDRSVAGTTYDVETISLTDMLDKYKAPSLIDYLSIDTEGSEYKILAAHDFSRYMFKVITCEHNYTPARHKIHELLISKGYTRKFENVSKFDDWYILKT